MNNSKVSNFDAFNSSNNGFHGKHSGGNASKQNTGARKLVIKGFKGNKFNDYDYHKTS